MKLILLHKNQKWDMIGETEDTKESTTLRKQK